MAIDKEEVETKPETKAAPDAEESHESLETLYGGEDTPEAEPEQEQQVAPEGEEATKEKEVATGEEQPAAGENDDLTDEQEAALPPAEKGQYKAMKAERGKRKAAEGQVTALTANVETLTGQVQQLMGMLKNPTQAQTGKETEAKPEEEAKTYWEAPEDYTNAAIAKALEGVTGTVGKLSEAQQAMRNNFSEVAAKGRYEDYGTNVAALVDALKNHPDPKGALAYKEQLMSSADPAEAAYQAGKQIRLKAEIAQAGGFDAYVDKLAADKLAALQEGAADDEADEVVKNALILPTSMANRRGVGAGNKVLGTDYSKDQSLEDLYD